MTCSLCGSTPAVSGRIPVQTLRVTRRALRCWRLCAAAACVCQTLRDLAGIWSHGRTPPLAAERGDRNTGPSRSAIWCSFSLPCLALPIRSHLSRRTWRRLLLSRSAVSRAGGICHDRVRRMHDSGHSGWWFLCPLVNAYLTLMMAIEVSIDSVRTQGGETRTRLGPPAQSGS